MNRNIGTIDRIIRAVFSIVVAVLYIRGYIDGTVAAVLGTVAFVVLATGTIGYSPLYLLFKIDTKKKNK
ncbi:MAG TPA: DUF2892 domain-containing protein [Spirochaetota bacterium]|nr:DUF2892 domain-containing protein [Spirochaetota bacterium]